MANFWAISFHFRPFLAPYMVRDDPDCASIIHFTLWINVALTMFVPKSISWNGGAPDGQVQVISGLNMVQYGTDWASSIHFLLEINIALQKTVLKSISEAGGYPDGQFWAISGHFWPRTRSEMIQTVLQLSISYWESMLLYKILS